MPEQKYPRIIIATMLPEFGGNGPQTACREFREYLEERNIPCRVITPFSVHWLLFGPLFGIRKLIDPVSGRLSVWWLRFWHHVLLRRALKQELKDGKPAIVYAQCPPSANAALMARVGVSQKVVLSVRFNISQADEWVLTGKITENDWVYRWIRQFEADVMPRLDGIFYVSRFMEGQLLQRFPALKQVKSAVLPNFVSSHALPSQVSKKWDLVSIGTLEPRKNQQYLLHVLAEVARRGRNYSLLLVGDGPDRGKLEHLATSLGIAHMVTFAGYKPNAGIFLHDCRVFAHSAHMESFGFVLIEALSCGLPIMAVPVGGIPEIFSDGREGYYVSFDNLEEIAEKAIRLLEDPFLYRSMSVAALERFEQNFSREKGGARLLEFLRTFQ